jgi:hypothetical protein
MADVGGEDLPLLVSGITKGLAHRSHLLEVRMADEPRRGLGTTRLPGDVGAGRRGVRDYNGGPQFSDCVRMVHYARNLLGMVGAARRKDLAEGLRGVFAAASRESALLFAEELADRWRPSHPKVSEHLEEHVEECLACLSFPASHRRRIRTTNGLERFNQELRRRTRVVRIFPNREACLRLVSALAVEQSEEWVTGRRYLDMEELREHRRSEEPKKNGMMLMER